MLTEAERAQLRKSEPGFVEMYVNYAKQLTDAPLDYHRGCAFVALSAAYGNLLYEPLFGTAPNVWCLLLGPSTIYRKTTSLRILEKLLVAVGEIDFLPTDFSPQSLLGAVAAGGGSSQVLLRDEVTGLFSQLTRTDYMAGAKELLIKLFDGDKITRKLRKEEIVVDKSHVSFVAGAVHERLMNVISDADVLSGFMVRWILLLPTSKEPYKPLSYVNPRIEQEHVTLVNRLKTTREIFGTDWKIPMGGGIMGGTPPYYFTLNTVQLARFNQYIRALEEESTDPVSEKINSRMGPLSLKIAVLLQADQGRKTGVWGNSGHITQMNFLKALWYTELFREHTLRALGATSANQGEQLLNKVVELIRVEPDIRRGLVMKSLKLTAKQMDEITETLVQREIIKLHVQHGGGRPSTHFSLVSMNGHGPQPAKTTEKTTK